ncbi:hypothetical protein V8C44DRAFT_321463 [Trichoderma aethiopicum]
MLKSRGIVSAAVRLVLAGAVMAARLMGEAPALLLSRVLREGCTLCTLLCSCPYWEHLTPRPTANDDEALCATIQFISPNSTSSCIQTGQPSRSFPANVRRHAPGSSPRLQNDEAPFLCAIRSARLAGWTDEPTDRRQPQEPSPSLNLPCWYYYLSTDD